jgi:hemerythrin-like domain-containing protein
MAQPASSISASLARAHAGLLADLQKLEDAVHDGAATDLGALRARLGVTRSHVIEHFHFEEMNGYMDAVRKREPRLERQVEALADEHRQLGQMLDSLTWQVGSATQLNDPLRGEIRAWIERLRQHEARENRFIQEVFNQDISAED